MNKKVNIVLALLASLVGALILSFSAHSPKLLKNIDAGIIQNSTFFPQEIIGMSKEAHQNFALYDQGKLIGYVSSELVLTNLFQQTYQERFQETFPGAKVGLGADAYVLSETSYYYYENIDEAIINYINDNELFAVEAIKITFSNGVTCYVKDLAIFTQANEEYLLNFVSKEEYELLKNNQLPPPLDGYGVRNVGLMVLETATVGKGFASPNRVYQTVDEVVTFLGYGDKVSIKDYVVERFDTIEGVASKTGISVSNLMTINKDKIFSTDQVLSEGMVLNVAEFTSPITVVVKQETLERENLLPTNPQLIVDHNYPLTYREVLTEARMGYQNTLYLSTVVNGVEYSTEMLQVNVIESPVDMVVRVGTAVLDDSVDGLFIWPTVGRKRLTCRYLCYPGHYAIDIQPNGSASYDLPILAAMDGVVSISTYTSGCGWVVKIKHNGGYQTKYCHMIRKPIVQAGQIVYQGQVIGNMGNTGKSTGVHLHFEIILDGERRNPCLWLGC